MERIHCLDSFLEISVGMFVECMVGRRRAPNSARRISYFETEQEKFAASSVLPVPLYFANWG